ncbi:MAG TPA: serine/threonine-protein kinase, partial [Polyangiaceae bacterium]
PRLARSLGPHQLLAVGDVLAGTYEVRGLIGEGGMGQVYDAWDVALGRSVAIKAVARRERDLLHREARALAALRHPSVVAVHAIGEHERVAYVVMDRIHGKSLQAHLDARREEGRRFALDEAIDLLIGIAEALAVVHGAGMAHRDVTPANVMVAPGDRVVLTDFGIFQPEIEVAGRLHCAGSPRHMAPEAIGMSVEPGELYLVDVYALGVIAYELLTGALPYDDPCPMKILWKHIHAPVPDPLAGRAEAPRGLVALVREMLAKEPKDRPQSMEAIAWRLRHARPSRAEARGHR